MYLYQVVKRNLKLLTARKRPRFRIRLLTFVRTHDHILEFLKTFIYVFSARIIETNVSFNTFCSYESK